MAAGVIHVPWYATGFQHDALAIGLERIAALSVRYGALSYAVYRSRDDRYKFLEVLEFETKLDWERYWLGPELTAFRIDYSGSYQVPVVYGWQDVVCRGTGPGGGGRNGAGGEAVGSTALSESESS